MKCIKPGLLNWSQNGPTPNYLNEVFPWSSSTPPSLGRGRVAPFFLPNFQIICNQTRRYSRFILLKIHIRFPTPDSANC